ncbi:MAG: hypothetical protein HZA37_01750 [Parcubacteria group bacterium]|nr:hypothetical protein [Parcubacteria group bacterium]
MKFFRGKSKTFLKFLKPAAIIFFIAVLGFSNLGPVVLNYFGAEKLAQNLKVKEAQAATYTIQTGTYVGNGTAKAITGLGFAPQAVIIKPDTTAGVGALLKTTAMPAPNVAYLGAATADLTTGITLNADGFTVDGANTNTASIVHTWIAFTGSDCSASGVFCVGSYQGTAAAKAVTTGFQPNLVMVKPATAVAPSWRSSSMATNVGQYFAATTQDTTGVLFTTLDATGFTVGATNSPTGATVYFLAFKAVANSIAVGTYTGNATDNTNIAVSGFSAAPNFVFLKNANAATAVSAMYNVSESYGDTSNYFTDTANLADSIQVLQSTGFQVGTNSTANGSGNAIFYAAFGGAAAKSSGSGTFKMATGSYTGTAQVLTVDNLSFKPDLVIIKGGSTAGVFRTSMMGGDSTAYLDSATANITGAITALNPDGFTVGISTAVNTNAVVYYWTAYGNAFNPDNNSGSADFVIGAYYGNGVAAARSVSRMPFQPNLLSIKSASAIGGVFKTSAHTGTISSFYSATADAASGQISSLDANGFTLGTTVTNTNVSATTIWYFGFKSGTNFTVNSYTGTGASQNITTVGFQPDNIWVKRTTAVQGVTRTSAMAADSALPFIAAGTITSAITGIISTGFTVLTATETNVSAGSYWYAAWKATVGGAPVPDATSVTYIVGGDGGRSGDSITITGTNFGTVTDGSQANCAGASGTGCINFIVGGSATVADVDIANGAWTNTQIIFTVSSTLASNGGVASLQVVAASQSDATPLTFYIYPRISGIIDDFGGVNDTAREYDDTDDPANNSTTDLRDGEIQINGDHFDSAGSVTILGQSAPSVTIATRCGGSSYTSTCITVKANTTIGDGAGGAGDYVGNVIVTRTSDSKGHSYAGFRVLPRITGFTPSSEAEGQPVTVNGNHFCQNAGACPGVFDANNKVTFYNNVDATAFTSWSNTAMGTAVPTGAVSGNVILKSNSYDSNGKSFTVLSSTPNDPDLSTPPERQFKNSGLTQSISVGGVASATPIYLAITMSSGLSTGTLYPQIEYKAIGTSFACTGGGGAPGANNCSATAEGTGKAAPGPWDCSVSANGCAISITPSDGDYHWQARVCRNNGVGTHTNTCGGTGDYASNWVSFGGNGDPNGVDFKMDTAVPVITFSPTNTCAGGQSELATNGIKISWTFNPTSDLADGQVEYSVNADLSGSASAPVPAAGVNTSHAITLSNLNSGTTYYYKAKSKDIAGNSASNPSAQPFCSFSTTSVTQPAKTTRFHVMGTTTAITNANPGSYSFTATTTELSPSMKSSFMVLAGIYETTVISPQVIVQYESESPITYALPGTSSGTLRSYFQILHRVNTVNTTSTNTLTVTPNTSTSVYINSADLIMTYGYTP